MSSPDVLDRLVGRVATQIRWRRAEHCALRGLFWGLLAAMVPLVVKGPLAGLGLPLGLTAVGAGALGGLVYGLARRVAPLDAARLADRAFGLQDRVATALQFGRAADAPPLVQALVADARTRVESLQMRQIVRRVLPREVRFVPVPLALALGLAFAPPVPMPSTRLFERAASGAAEEAKEHQEGTMLEDRPRPLARDPLRRPAFEERDFAARGASGAPSTQGDLGAIFKDTSLATQRPDFNSFLKKGDERLKMLEQVDRLPDLQSDFTGSQYKMVFRKSKALRSGLRPDQISPDKLRELLKEMERLGRKGGSWSPDAAEGMEALESGHQDRALQAMEKALDKMRAAEEARQRGGKNLRGGKDERGGRRGDNGRPGGGPDEQDPGEGEGLLPGKGRSASPKGEASQRLRANPFDAGVEGESRRGRKDAYDTNMTGRGGAMNSRLQYLGVIGQYRKLMEDAIAREQVPRDYHSQVKDYFQALDER